MATSDSFIKQELKDLWAVKPIQFDHFYIHSQDSINRLLPEIPDKFAEEQNIQQCQRRSLFNICFAALEVRGQQESKGNQRTYEG